MKQLLQFKFFYSRSLNTFSRYFLLFNYHMRSLSVKEIINSIINLDFSESVYGDNFGVYWLNPNDLARHEMIEQCENKGMKLAFAQNQDDVKYIGKVLQQRK